MRFLNAFLCDDVTWYAHKSFDSSTKLETKRITKDTLYSHRLASISFLILQYTCWEGGISTSANIVIVNFRHNREYRFALKTGYRENHVTFATYNTRTHFKRTCLHLETLENTPHQPKHWSKIIYIRCNFKRFTDK